jgi:Immunity protein Imm1
VPGGRTMASWTDQAGVGFERLVGDPAIGIRLFHEIDRTGEPVMIGYERDNGACLIAAVGRPLSVLSFCASADPPYSASLGDLTRDGYEHWFFGGTYTEVARNLIAKTKAIEAVAEFCAMGTRPTVVDWEQV